MLGVMLDCSRNAVMKVSELKNFIIKLEKMGYNLLQLYTEDTYEIESEPLFGYLRGRYTKEELKEVDAFAKEHNIELMPCIQTLAHLNQIMFYPGYQQIADVGDILLAGEDKTYELIDKMFKTCAECFTSRKINIGMDEAHMLGLGKYLDKHGYQNRSEVLLLHLHRVCDIAKKYGFTPVMWSDMFFRLAFEDYYTDSAIPEEIMQKVPDNIELCYWDYYSEEYEKYNKILKNHLKFNRNVWFAGGAWKWLGFQSSNQKSFDTTKPALTACRDNGVENILITMWGDNGNDCPPYTVLPALVYASECAKGNFDLENAKQKFTQLFNENWDDFMLCDIKMPSELPKRHGLACGAKEMLYTDYFLGRLDSSVIGKETAIYKEYAEKFKQAKLNSKNYGYMFESYEKLSLLMSEKYDLGYLTRKAYQSKDIKQLKKLIKRYKKVLVLLEDFVNAFRKQWFMVNKPHGFDTQEIRLGGITLRTKSCLKRLTDYVNGKIPKIEELEEKLVDCFTGGEPEPQIVEHNAYVNLATINIL